MTFRLRSPNGKNSGRYFAGREGFETLWADDPNEAPIYSVRDAYGNIAAAIDTSCQALVPERTESTTDENVAEFAKIAANDMWQKPSDVMVNLVSKAVRSIDDPIHEPDESELPKADPSYMSVWEWLHRAIYGRDVG